MKTYTIHKLDTNDERIEQVGTAELPNDETSLGFAHAFADWVTRERVEVDRLDGGNWGYEAVPAADQAGRGA